MKLDWDALQQRWRSGDWLLPIAILVMGLCLMLAVVALSGCASPGSQRTWNNPGAGFYGK